MTIATFANQFIFPILLFAAFYTLFNLGTIPFKKVTAQANFNLELENFYEAVEQDDNFTLILESASNYAELIGQITKYGRSLGYQIIEQEVKSSIEEHTDLSQENYICLPIGCFAVDRYLQ